jgi:hypothetical protein
VRILLKEILSHSETENNIQRKKPLKSLAYAINFLHAVKISASKDRHYTS